MGPLLSMATCPNCGAPHEVAANRQSVICLFCNTSLRVDRPAGPMAVARLTAQTVAKDDIERIKQLLIDGKRNEAVAQYARVASVSVADAELAVDNLFLSAFGELSRHLPINALGFLMFGGLIFAGLAVAGFGAMRAMESPAYFVLVAMGGIFAITQFVRFLGHLSSTLVAAFGATGHARVIRSSTVREWKERDEYFLVVLFEVTPDDGRPTFVDQETVFAGIASRQKLAPGNVVRVRFDRACQHVFLIRPLTVLSSSRI
jgi:hypothetical protein